jgi:MYXO-CTERM domain-containing protein
VRGAAVAIVVVMTLSANAFADEEVESLLARLNDEHAALSTQDCVTACKAYASIRRAADKICGLEPGPRCADAQAKADDAQRRVQAACPDCHLASGPKKEDELRPTASKPVSTGEESESAPRKGGCASCSTPGERPTGDLGVAVLGALAVARALRKRQRRSVC